MSFNKLFQSSVAIVLDCFAITGNMEQTIPMLSKGTKLSYKTIQTVINHLVRLRLIKKTRKIDNAQAYQFQKLDELQSIYMIVTKIDRFETVSQFLTTEEKRDIAEGKTICEPDWS